MACGCGSEVVIVVGAGAERGWRSLRKRGGVEGVGLGSGLECLVTEGEAGFFGRGDR